VVGEGPAEHVVIDTADVRLRDVDDHAAMKDRRGAGGKGTISRPRMICGAVVRALGGEALCELAAEMPRLPTWPGISAEERALRNVIFGNALIEMVNTANLVDILDSMSDPCLREATRLLLADEVQHSTFGFAYLEAWAPWLAARPEVRSSLDRFLRRAFAELERVRAGSPRPRTLTPDQIALGIANPARLTLVLHHTVEGAIIPALEGFGLAARAAWRERGLDA